MERIKYTKKYTTWYLNMKLRQPNIQHGERGQVNDKANECKELRRESMCLQLLLMSLRLKFVIAQMVYTTSIYIACNL